MKLDEELDRAIGDGPPHRPVGDRIVAGRRAVRRRQAAASGAAALVVLAVVGGTWSLVGGGDPGRSTPAPPVGEPTERRASDPTTPGRVTFSDRDCGVQGDDVTVLDEVEISSGGAGMACQRASEYETGGSRMWVLVSNPGSVDGDPLFDVVGPVAARAGTTLRSWVARHVETPSDAAGPQVPSSFPAEVRGWVGFRDDGTLAPGDGVAILDQTSDVDLRDFVLEPGDRAAAAQVVLDGKAYFVLARDVDGIVDLIADEPSTGEETLAQFLERMASLYDSGAGAL